MAEKSEKQTRLDGINDLRTYLAVSADVIQYGGASNQDAVEKLVDDLLDVYRKYQEGGESDD